ncbi:MAG: response regulator transcription factor [Hespellia sp.]|nr:response regulator transcription factor [Hespellia sp.]
MTNILIVEDDRTLSDGIVLAMKREGLAFDQAYTFQEGMKHFAKEDYQMVLLDVNLPDGNGYELLKAIRETSQVPVLMLTARDMEMDEVMGLELGADDYMTKPFSLAVLRARMGSLLRRNLVSGNRFTEDSLSFDFENLIFTRAGEELYLSKGEQRLLRLLTKNADHPMSRNLLVDRMWTDDAEYVDENALSVTIRRLREKIEEDPSHPVYIQTVYGVGYIWKKGNK